MVDQMPKSCPSCARLISSSFLNRDTQAEQPCISFNFSKLARFAVKVLTVALERYHLELVPSRHDQYTLEGMQHHPILQFACRVTT